jgi:hypothetical protein
MDLNEIVNALAAFAAGSVVTLAALRTRVIPPLARLAKLTPTSADDQAVERLMSAVRYAEDVLLTALQVKVERQNNEDK